MTKPKTPRLVTGGAISTDVHKHTRSAPAGRNTTVSPARLAIEAHLLKHLDQPQTVQDMIPVTSLPSWKICNVLGNMRTDAQIRVTGKINGRNAYVHKTSALREATQTKAAEAAPYSLAAPRSCSVMSGTYDGAELRPFAGRPGAMDAFSMPSRGIAD